MPIYDASVIVTDDYNKLGEAARFSQRTRQAAYEMVEMSGVPIEEIAAILRRVAQDVENSIK